MSECKTVSAREFNEGLRIRRQITGNDQRFRRRPVCVSTRNKLRRSIERSAKQCQAGAPSQVASWYGPGFYGNKTASGQVLTRSTIGVAHKSIRPWGTRFYFHFRGRTERAPVIDDGPHVAGREWDLTGALAKRLGFSGVAPVQVSTRNCWAVWR